MLAGIERWPIGSIRSTPASSSSFDSLRSTALSPSRSDRQGCGRVAGHQPVHIVEHVEKLGHEAGLGPVAQFGAFPGDALAIVVELRREAEVPVLQLCNLALQLPPRGRRRSLVGSSRFAMTVRRSYRSRQCRAASAGLSAVGIEIASKVGFFSHLETLTLEDVQKIIATRVPAGRVSLAGTSARHEPDATSRRAAGTAGTGPPGRRGRGSHAGYRGTRLRRASSLPSRAHAEPDRADRLLGGAAARARDAGHRRRPPSRRSDGRRPRPWRGPPARSPLRAPPAARRGRQARPS